MEQEQLSPEDPQHTGRSESTETDETAAQTQSQRCAELEALLPAYALGATDPEEAAMVRAALADCPQAAQKLAEYEALAESLLYSAPPQRLPPHLATRIQAAIAQPAPTPARPGPLDRLRQAWQGWSLTGRLAGAALALLLVVNGYWIQHTLRLQQELRQMNEKLQQQNIALFVLASESRQQLTLPPAQEGSQAHASVIWTPEYDTAILLAESFPRLTDDQVYQLWLLKDGERISAGLFTVDDLGAGALVFHTPQPLDQYDIIGITPEPAGGSPGPTAPPVVRLQM